MRNRSTSTLDSGREVLVTHRDDHVAAGELRGDALGTGLSVSQRPGDERSHLVHGRPWRSARSCMAAAAGSMAAGPPPVAELSWILMSTSNLSLSTPGARVGEAARLATKVAAPSVVEGQRNRRHDRRTLAGCGVPLEADRQVGSVSMIADV